MAYYFDCTGCDNLFINREDCSCPLCGKNAEPRLVVGLTPAKSQVRFAPEYAASTPFNVGIVQAQSARPARVLAASLLLIIAICAFGIIGGESKAMEACQLNHSYEVCFSSLNP